MASTSSSISDIDLFIFFKSQMNGVNHPDVNKIKKEILKDSLKSWIAIGDPVYLAPHVVRLSFDSAKSLSELQDQRCEELRLIRLNLGDVETLLDVEFVILPATARDVTLRLAVFDMDSTLIQAEVIDELARGVGKLNEVAAITSKAMNGEVDFAESLRLRVSLLRGVPTTIWDTMKAQISFMPGARDLTSALRRANVKMAVFSGGFREMALWAGNELGIHRAAANQLVSSEATQEFPYPHLTGELDPAVPIVTAAKKRELLLAFAKEHMVPLSQTLCIGDGANDLSMLGACGSNGGTAIAFRAKETVQKNAPNRLNSESLNDVLYLLDLDPPMVSKTGNTDSSYLSDSEAGATELMSDTG